MLGYKISNSPLDPNNFHLILGRVLQRRDSIAFMEEKHPKEEDRDKTQKPRITFNGEQPLEFEIEEFLLCLCVVSNFNRGRPWVQTQGVNKNIHCTYSNDSPTFSLPLRKEACHLNCINTLTK